MKSRAALLPRSYPLAGNRKRRTCSAEASQRETQITKLGK